MDESHEHADLAARLGALAKDATESAYEQAELDALWVDIERKTARRRPTWTLVAAACAACLVAGGLLSWVLTDGADPHGASSELAQQSQETPAPVRHEGRFELPDGSLALALDDESELAWTRDESGTTVTLESGAAVFDVAAQPRDSSFRVRAGRAEVEVIGTRFTVSHRADGVEVDVAFGRVAVHVADAPTVLLGAGESTIVPTQADTQVAAVAADDIAAAPGEDPAGVADAGAEPLVGQSTPQPKPPSVDALLDRADAARRRGDHKAAARALQTLLDEHAKDPQAALAAYTLGRIHLSDLDQPKQAAKAFARARALAPRGTMAEDALAKEIESWEAADRTDTAKQRAELYLERYPDGRWTKLAQRYAAP